MADDRRHLTLEEFDAMSPAERAAATEAHYRRSGSFVTNLDELPTTIRARVITTAERIASDRTRIE